MGKITDKELQDLINKLKELDLVENAVIISEDMSEEEIEATLEKLQSTKRTDN